VTGTGNPGAPPAGPDAVDAAIAAIYRAAAGLQPWVAALRDVEHLVDAWLVYVMSIDKRNGTIVFNYESGKAPPEGTLDYIRKYIRLDPRTAFLMSVPVLEPAACWDHFDEAFVATSPFYQDFLIPYGGRYTLGVKLADDAERVMVLGLHRGVRQVPFDTAERALVARLARHFAEGFRVHEEVSRAGQRSHIGFEIIDRMAQPIVLVDPNRRIAFANPAGKRVLARGDLFLPAGDYLSCADPDCDVRLMMALRSLVLAPQTAASAAAPPAERTSLRIRRKDDDRAVVATLIALRPQATMGSFGATPHALVTLYDSSASPDTDPFALAATFDFTPAEAKVASRIAAGLTIKEVAGELGLSSWTVRSHLDAMFGKTGTRRQADLVRVLLLTERL
jgi:DNA-binding CsgD family transcriptional regulator